MIIETRYCKELGDAVVRANRYLPDLRYYNVPSENVCYVFDSTNVPKNVNYVKHLICDDAIAILNHIAEFGVNEVN